MEAFLQGLLPPGCTFEIHPFQCKQDILGKLQTRLLGYRYWLPANWRLIVLVDQDDDDCRELKTELRRRGPVVANCSGRRTVAGGQPCRCRGA